MLKTQIISELFDTVICGNKIKGNKTYEKMLAKVSVQDIAHFIAVEGYEIKNIRFINLALNSRTSKTQVYSLNEFGGIEHTITKVELFNYIKKSF